MADAPGWQKVLQSLVAPLSFLARDDFACLDKLRDFEPLVRSVASRARDAGADASTVERIVHHVKGFDTAVAASKKDAIAHLAFDLAALVALTPELQRVARPNGVQRNASPAAPGPGPKAPPVQRSALPPEGKPSPFPPIQRKLTPIPERGMLFDDRLVAPGAPKLPQPPPGARVEARPYWGESKPPVAPGAKAKKARKAPIQKAQKPKKAKAPRRKGGDDVLEAKEPEGQIIYSPISGPLATPLAELGAVRGRLSGAIKQKNFTKVGELLFYFPRAYEDRRRHVPIIELKPGERGVSVGTVKRVEEVQQGRRRIFKVLLEDDRRGTIAATWFTYQPWMKKRYEVGQRWAFSGEVKVFGGLRQVTHPEMELAEELENDHVNFGRIVPVYPGFERTDQRPFRILAHKAVQQFAPMVDDPMPPHILARVGLPPLGDAIKKVHFPDTTDLAALEERSTPSQRRLAFDELFFMQLGLALRKKGVKLEPGIAFEVGEDLILRSYKRLPFELTGAQKRSVREVAEDMKKPEPMNRLVQGDVGSGKTAVAMACASIAIENGYQVAMMVPTEILAEQHHRNLGAWMAKAGWRAELLSAGLTKKEKDEAKAAVASGEAKLVVGTHAVIEGDVAFKNLGLVIIDEQHRFGVLQRQALMSKGRRPDVLVMTATPIPRTLAMVLYGDLELSVLDELPPGRTPIITRVFRERNRMQAFTLVAKELEKGRQAYVIYPLVEESETLDLTSATEGAEELQAKFPNHKVGLLHGQMKSDEKDAVMAAFRAGEVHILVSTTVVEVGVDVPNATVMVVENAARFGLSQLHQLRGRVGRGKEQSYCYLVGGDWMSDVAWQRLSIMEKTADGFRIAEEDLAIRGPGEFLGTRQSGLPGLSVADLSRDMDLLEVAKAEATRIADEDPLLKKDEHAPLRRALDERWEGKLALGKVG